ncbi:MAG: threonine synthase [Woeseia sp.]
MKYSSTRGAAPVTLEDALLSGIAADGGLYVPETLPRFHEGDFDVADTAPDVAKILLTPFFEGSVLAVELDSILEETFAFPIPATPLPVDKGEAALLELFHGPTAAFKDVGAGFLSACLSRLTGEATSPLTILVATSGDTGGAVAAAFNERPGMRVVVLFPEGRVSERQAHQLTCWGDNILSLAVAGSFDDCQAIVKSAMADRSLGDRYRFSSANSINIGRLLPQCTYYAATSLRHWRKAGRKPGFIVPTGNLGNAFACILARAMGLPIGEIALATNANRIIADYLAGAEWLPRESIPTLASAMDVGNPSNMERLRSLLGNADSLKRQLRVDTVSDREIERQIKYIHARFGIAICPHTATASHVYAKLAAAEREAGDWIIVATAHPAKFELTVEPLIGETLALPESLRKIQSRPSRSVSIDPDMRSFEKALHARFHLDEAAQAGDK